MKKIFLVYLYIIVGLLPTFAQIDTAQKAHPEDVIVLEELTPDELWAKGNNAYINGNFSKAVEYYTQIEKRGLASLPLYYNLGNGYFKLGDTAKSLLYLHRAQKLDPSDADTKYNIEVVQAGTKDNIESIPQFILVEWNEIISSSLSIVGWSIISLVAWSALLTFIIIFVLSRQLSKRKMGFYGMLIAAVVMFISTAYAIGERDEIVDNNEAIVMTQSLSAKSSPTTTATDLFVLHAGTKVEVISSLEGWSKIVIADGRQGWVKSELLEII
ncbi:MAG: tetratricopeptide repeat protein [Rikenellaceae bacterium]